MYNGALKTTKELFTRAVLTLTLLSIVGAACAGFNNQEFYLNPDQPRSFLKVDLADPYSGDSFNTDASIKCNNGKVYEMKPGIRAYTFYGGVENLNAITPEGYDDVSQDPMTELTTTTKAICNGDTKGYFTLREDK